MKLVNRKWSRWKKVGLFATRATLLDIASQRRGLLPSLEQIFRWNFKAGRMWGKNKKSPKLGTDRFGFVDIVRWDGNWTAEKVEWNGNIGCLGLFSD